MNVTNTDAIEKTVTLRAPRSRVWRAITNAKEFGEWFRVKLEGSFAEGAITRGPGGSRMRPAPITRMRSAPRWIAGEIGAVWRIEPSPNHSYAPCSGSVMAGNMKGIAAEASRCAMVSGVCTASRLERIHGRCSAADW